MAQRRNADRGLMDAWMDGVGGPRTTAMLDRLDAAVAWEALVKPILKLPEFDFRHFARWCSVRLSHCSRWRVGLNKK